MQPRTTVHRLLQYAAGLRDTTGTKVTVASGPSSSLGDRLEISVLARDSAYGIFYWLFIFGVSEEGWEKGVGI